ncbi:MAG: hypothetical protein WHU10_05300 [Fimbriimonadales bacterium]
MRLDGRFWFGFFTGVAAVATVLAVRRALHGEDPDELVESLSKKLATLESSLGIGALGDLLSDEEKV